MSVVGRGIKNSFRNLIRTFSIVIILSLSIGLALTMLISYKTVQSKIESVKSSIGNTISISPAGMRGFEGGGEALTEPQAATLSKLDHVTSVTKSLSDRLTTQNSTLVSAVDAGTLGRRLSENNGQTVTPPADEAKRETAGTTRSFTPPVTLTGTTDPTNLSSAIGGGTFNLISGEPFAKESGENVALIGTKLAVKNNLVVGSTFSAYSNTLKVVGIFDAGNDFSNNQVLTPLLTAQKITAQTGAISSMIVTVDSLSNIDSTTSAVKTALGTSADVTNSSEQAKTTIAPLENIKSISLISLVGSLVAGAIIILLTMMMIVRERRREIGVLKAIGATNFKVMIQFVVESMTFTLMGTVVGIAIGFFASNPVTKLLIQNSSTVSRTAQVGAPGMGRIREFAGSATASIQNIQAVVGWDIILYGIGAAVLIATIGSAVPAWIISKIRPAEVMRAE